VNLLQTPAVRILFTFAGGLGHLNPLLPLARAAGAAGNDVALAGKPSVLATVEPEGLTVFATGAENDAAQTERGPLEPVDRERDDRVLRDGFAGEVARRRVSALTAVAGDWQPDVFVCDETDFGGTLAAEDLGLPHVTMLVTASGSFVRPELLAGVFDVDLLSRHLVLNPFPPGFRDPRHPLPAPTRGVRLYDATPHAPGERPRVYFSLGTIFDLESGDLFERVLDALATVDVDAVATIGRRLERSSFAAPPNVRIEQYVPQERVLPASDLVISHGGSGSVLGAIAFRLPLVVLPLGADQPLNGDRCAATGIGRVVDPTASSAEIADAVRDVLADPSYREAAERLRSELDAFASPSEAVRLLEALA
jgi:UDP:flavonoid glycosyltransferase YjiC (YdhE family)